MKILAKWTELENILSEVTQTRKDKYHTFFLICVSELPSLDTLRCILRDRGAAIGRERVGHKIYERIQ